MEKVLVVKTKDLEEVVGTKKGFIGFDKKVLGLIKNKSFFVSRDSAENDESLKQIIPYCMIANKNKILAVKRKNPGEKRLKDLLSIGIGGHINPGDQGTDILFNAALRELREETDFSGGTVSKVVGFLSLDDTPVSRVHFGVVYKTNVDREISVTDAGLEGNFVSMDELSELSGKMEGWSRALVETALNEIGSA